MSIKYAPQSGQIIFCDFTEGFKEPEMVKKRPVIVISARKRSYSPLCIVVPLSTTKPHMIEAHHIEITMPQKAIDALGFSPVCWAKCDMVNTVSLHRLDLLKYKKRDQNGKRQYFNLSVNKDTLLTIRKAVAGVIGLTD